MLGVTSLHSNCRVLGCNDIPCRLTILQASAMLVILNGTPNGDEEGTICTHGSCEQRQECDVAILPRCAQSFRAKDHVDTFMCSLQSTIAKIASVRFCSLSMWMGMARSTINNRVKQKGAAAPKIIEFHVPNNFRRRGKWLPAQDCGKIIEFKLQTRKSA